MRRAMSIAVCCLAAAGWAAPGASAVTSLASPPPGANDFGCRPSAAHPRPVVLVHGLSATMGANFGYLSPLLEQRGYCVFALTYGLDPRIAALGAPGGVIPIEQSAAELGAFVDRVLAATGAAKVDLVGHSEGTYMPQYWLKFLGGAAKVRRYVAWTPLYGGTSVYGIDRVRDLAGRFGLGRPAEDLVALFCGSCPQFVTGSDMQRRLTAGGAAAPGVTYTTVMTKYDELVIPYTSGIMRAPGATNVVLQHVCPGDLSEHAAVAFDPVAAQLAFNALDPADARPVDCRRLPPYTGRRAGGAAAARAALRAVALRATVRRFRVRRLTLVRVPAVSRVTLTACRPARRKRCAIRTRRYAVARERRSMALARALRRRRLRAGTVIGVTVTQPGLGARGFAVRVLRSGRGRMAVRCLGPDGGRLRC